MTGGPPFAVWLPPQRSSVLPVQAAAFAARPDSIGGRRRQRFAAGLYANPTVARGAGLPPRGAPAPPMTRTSRPSQTATAPPRDSGSGEIRRHVSVAGLYAAARASRAGHIFPSGPTSPTKTTNS